MLIFLGVFGGNFHANRTTKYLINPCSTKGEFGLPESKKEAIIRN